MSPVLARITPPARGDLVAGITVALVLVPQALAYAAIAGLDPAYGLYAAVAAPIAGALIGSSPYLQTGPVAVTSLLTFGALAPLAEPQSVRFAALAAVLAVIVGLVRLAIGLIGAGPIAYLMSQPVVVSFTSAASVLIVSTQVPALLGVDVDARNPLVGALDALVTPAGWAWVDIALGLGAILVVLGGRRLGAFFPGALVAVVAATAWSHFAGYDGATVGAIDLQFHTPQAIALGDLGALLLPGLVIAVVGFAEPASIARHYAAEDRQPWNSNREFVGQGLANLASGAAGGLPVGGSFSRTSLNRLSGARTRWSGAFTGFVVLAILPFAGLLAPLPLAVLAGLVISAVVSLVDVRKPLLYWHWSKPQFAVGVVTAVSTLALAPRVERGVVLGVAAALAVHLWREMGVHVPAHVENDTLHLRPSGVLYFGSAPSVERAVNEVLGQHAAVTKVVLHLDSIGRLDLTGALMLRDLVDEARAGGRTFTIAGAGGHAAPLLSRVLGVSVTEEQESLPDQSIGGGRLIPPPCRLDSTLGADPR
jgi:SulP family sulfate permease